MGVLRDRKVLVLLVLVLAGSVLSVVLALSRQAPEGIGSPPGTTGVKAPGFRPADLEGPGGDALAAAVTALATTYGYDHADLDGSIAAATGTMTTEYATRFTRLFDTRVRPVATRQRDVVEGLVRGAGVVRAPDDSTVVCLLYVDQVLLEGRRITTAGETRVLTRSRLRVQMVRQDGAWKVDGIDALRVVPVR